MPLPNDRQLNRGLKVSRERQSGVYNSLEGSKLNSVEGYLDWTSVFGAIDSD